VVIVVSRINLSICARYAQSSECRDFARGLPLADLADAETYRVTKTG
jgi:hypothetical protein